MSTHENSHFELESSLALAVIDTSMAPLLLLDGELSVIAASKSFCRVFQIDPAAVRGCALRELGSGEWDIPQLASLLKATASGYAEIEGYEMDLRRDGQANCLLVVNARKLHYGEDEDVRLLMTIADVTEARIAEKVKDDLLNQKAILLQELQHRVANSLQIIASVLMQSARKVQSEESRSHLYNAHQRVLSLGTLQKHLSASSEDRVELRNYFAALSDSLSASMIRDHDQVRLRVSVDESTTRADVSVSLGLIVTELVINALKHAFPNGRKGNIEVIYASRGPNWALTVRDDGGGMPTDPSNATPGLGTSIVRALVQQLKATIEVSGAHPGTSVSVTHNQIEAVQNRDGAGVDSV